MRIIIKPVSGSSIYIANLTQDYSGILYVGRLQNQPSLSREKDATTSHQFDIKNIDNWISGSIELWGATLTAYSDSEHVWSGKVTGYETNASGVLQVTATEQASPELALYIPDEVARVVTVDAEMHVSALNLVIPLAFGGTSSEPLRLRGILINRSNGIYLVAVGELRQFVKVYRGNEEITTGYTSYVGTTTQADYKGFAYIHLDSDLRTNDDGTYPEIYVEVVGNKLGGSYTEAQCRNGARILYHLLTTAKDGVGGWGLGIDASDLNITTINNAITQIDTEGLKCDAIFTTRQKAKYWIDQIVRAIRGTYTIGDDGQRSLYIDAVSSSVKTYSIKNMKVLRYGKGAYSGQVYNKGTLDCGYNPITGQYMHSASYQDDPSIADIEEQLFYGQSQVISDATTAQKILEYTIKKSLVQANKILFETTELPTNAKNGDVITVDRSDLEINSVDYVITKLSPGEYVHQIQAAQYSASIFSAGTASTPVNWTMQEGFSTAYPPASASGLSLASAIVTNPDGTSSVAIEGTFVLPANNYLGAAISYGEGASPSVWRSSGMLRGNSFSISPLKAGILYSIKVEVINPIGKSSSIIGTITTVGDTTPPGIPTISASAQFKTVTIVLNLAIVPNDFAGFRIFRSNTANSADSMGIGSVSSKDGSATFISNESTYGTSFYYFAKAFDMWDNRSAFSAASDLVDILSIRGSDLVDGALNRSGLFAAGVVGVTAIIDGAITAVKTAIEAIDSSTGNLKANTVSALQILAEAVSTEKLAALCVIAEKIAAKAITAEKLLVGKAGSALNDDPNFEDESAWVLRGGSEHDFVTITNGIVGNTAARGVISKQPITARRIPIDHQKSYRLRAWFMQENTTETTNYITYRYVNADGTLQAQSWSTALTKATTAWESLYLIIDPPSTAVSVILGVDINYYSDASTVYVQDLRIEEVLPATLIKDGAITTAKIFANAIRALHILAGEIKTHHLEAEAVTADKVDATVVKTTELQVFGKNKCPDATFDSMLTGNEAITTGQTFGAWTFTSVDIAGVMTPLGYHYNQKLNSANLFGESNGAYIFSRNTGSEIAYSYMTSKKCRIVGSQNYTLSLYARQNETIALNKARIRAIIFWWKEDGTACSTASAEPISYVVVTAYDVVERISGAAVSPSDAAFATIQIYNVYSTVTHSIFASGVAFSAIQFEVGSSSTIWVPRATGTITADKIIAGKIKSIGYSTTAGSMFDLDSGYLGLGGSLNPVFEFDASTGKAKLSGFTCDADDMTAGTTTSAIGISTDTAKKAFWAGNTTPANAPFQVAHNGDMVAGSFAFDASDNTITGAYGGGGYTVTTTLGGNTSSCGFTSTYTTSSVVNQVIISADNTNPINVSCASTSTVAIKTDAKIECYDLVEISDSNKKEDLIPVSGILESMRKIKVWSYRAVDTSSESENNEQRYWGVMAQDFVKEFPTLSDGTHVRRIAYIVWGALQEYVIQQEEKETRLNKTINDLVNRIETLEAKQ